MDIVAALVAMAAGFCMLFHYALHFAGVLTSARAAGDYWRMAWHVTGALAGLCTIMTAARVLFIAILFLLIGQGSAVWAAPAVKIKAQVELYCGLFSGNWCALNRMRPRLEALGYHVVSYSHLAYPPSVSASAKAIGLKVYRVGHSAGADLVVLFADSAAMTFSIDATVANAGARGPVLATYNPANRIPLLICCGGAKVDDAISNRILRIGHVPMAAYPPLQDAIIAAIERGGR